MSPSTLIAPAAAATVDAGPDPLTVLALRSIALFPVARRLAWDLGPDLFPDPAARSLAACFIKGRPLPSPAQLHLRPDLGRLVVEVAHCRLPAPNEPEYGMYVVRLLAEQEHLPVLADQLAWARIAVLHRVPLRFVRRRVAEAFAVALGTRPLDACLITGGRRDWP